ncbi:YHS domain-containing (seleno)protein [Flavobacterium sp.]|uniref:YHS domain-containing (seleno)protein n=1 Tax=Flavobacterium sp. TaxID=239 RepID=UPI003D6BCAB8
MKNALLLVTLFLTFSGFSQTARKAAHFNLENKIAIQGYDPVAYFKQHKAIKGKKELASDYLGVTYYFSSKENAAAFSKNPADYEPQYGGWCAFAMGDYGKKVEINPETFKITDGKLYLFYNAFLTNTLKSWNKDEKRLKASADVNWKKIQN